MSKKKVIKAILLALSILLTAAQNADGKEETHQLNDGDELE